MLLFRFSTKLYKQIVGILMYTVFKLICFLFYQKSDFMASLFHDQDVGMFQVFNPTSRYLDDISDIDNLYF